MSAEHGKGYNVNLRRKDLLGLDGVSREEITAILDTALMMRQVVRSANKKTSHL